MEKVLILLGTANQPLFQECEKALKKIYSDTLRDYPMDVEVLSYAANDDNSIADIRLDCDDDMQYDKHRLLYQWVYKHGYQDHIIIKTNVSTVLNLKLLWAFIHNPVYDKNRVYGSATMWDTRYAGENYGRFIMGYFMMFHGHNLKAINDVIDDTFDKVMTPTVLREVCGGKHDLNDDMLMAPVFARIGVMPTILGGLNIACYKEEPWGIHEEWYLPFAACVRCKMVLPSKSKEARMEYEPGVMKLIGEFYRYLPFQPGNLNVLINNKMDLDNWKI